MVANPANRSLKKELREIDDQGGEGEGRKAKALDKNGAPVSPWSACFLFLLARVGLLMAIARERSVLVI
jgi:hypothetical protein